MSEKPSSAPEKGAEVAPVVPFPGLRSRPPRERLLEAMLLVSGELGYEQVAVKHVIERARASRATFYKHFEDREDCFAQAHHDASEWLYRRLIGAAKRQQSWREGLRAAMAELARVLRQPTGDRESDLRRGPCGGRAGARPAARFDGAPLRRA